MRIIKNTLYLGVAAFTVAGVAPQALADSNMHKSMDHGSEISMQHNKSMQQDSKAVTGKGIIRSIDMAGSKVNISHEAIPALKWPEMTMDLDVAKEVDLKDLSSGDKVRFHIELGDDKVYRITKIMKSDMKSEVHDLKYLEHTESKYICMVNNRRFDKVQIPTEVNGKTYYGCCSMCKARLENLQELREATDPISGKVVDKATAVIGTDPEGLAHYFENEENMRKFDELKSAQDSQDSSHHNHKH